MNALVSFLEKLLLGILALGLGILMVIGLISYHGSPFEEGDPWRHAAKQNTIEAYLEYLRACQSCPHEEEAERALDELQRERGLLARLSRAHLPERASIAHPAFSPNGRTVLASGGTKLGFWDAETGRHLARGEKAFAVPDGSYIESLAYSPDNRWIAAGLSAAEHGGLRVWDERSGEPVADYIVDDYDVKLVEFAPQGSRLGWLAQGPAGIWEPATGKILRVAHEGASALAFQRGEDGRSWLMTAAGRDVWFWDPATLELRQQVRFDSERPLLGLSRDGRLIAFSDGTVLELWNTHTRLLIAAFRDVEGEITSFCREPKKGWIVVGTRAGILYLWDPAGSPLPLGQVPAHKGPIEQLACSEGRVVTVGWDSAKVWSLDKLAQRAPRRKPSGLTQ
jgi:WD40 repeat protein